MSGDHDIPLLEFVHAFRAEVEPFYGRIHPSGACIVREYLEEMFEAAAEGDAAEVKRLVALAQYKLRSERLWRIECWLSSNSWRRPHPRIASWLSAKQRGLDYG